jgi:uncharacterized protein YigA (DUF484 family)
MTQNRSDAAPDAKNGKAGGGKAAAGAEANGASPALSDARVADYLRRHPDFLSRHPALLDVLHPPERRDGDNVLDLQHAMVARLRDDLAQLRGEHDELIYTGRANLAAQARVHEAILALLAAPTFEHLIETATSDLAVILDLDAAILCVEAEDAALPPVRNGGLRQVPPGLIDEVMGGARSSLLQDDVEGDGRVFGASAGLVHSQALLRLGISPSCPRAMLALGSRQPDYFHTGQGSELLGFLANALALVIRGWLELPE